MISYCKPRGPDSSTLGGDAAAGFRAGAHAGPKPGGKLKSLTPPSSPNI